jgi:hypothetical protein
MDSYQTERLKNDISYATEDVDESYEPPTSDLQELALIVAFSINHLFGLSVLVRRTRPKGRFRSPDKPIESPRDAVTVADNFPKAREQERLAQYLGNAIGRRQLFFNYRQQHRKRLAPRTDAIEKYPVAHLRQSHSDTITQEQAIIMLTVCEKPQTKFGSSECHLCSVSNPASADMDNAKGFFRHLAQHQQQLALDALLS